jgi:hypothetical protein
MPPAAPWGGSADAERINEPERQALRETAETGQQSKLCIFSTVSERSPGSLVR